MLFLTKCSWICARSSSAIFEDSLALCGGAIMFFAALFPGFYGWRYCKKAEILSLLASAQYSASGFKRGIILPDYAVFSAIDLKGT